MGTNMYPSFALLGQDKDESIAAFPVDEMIEKADSFSSVFPSEQQLPFTSAFLRFLFGVSLPTLPFSRSLLSLLCITVYIITLLIAGGNVYIKYFIFSFC